MTTNTGAITFTQDNSVNSTGSDADQALTVTTASTVSGSISISNDGGALTATTVTASSDGGAGDVTLITTTSGQINIGNITATSDTITITAAGAIEESGTDGEADLTALILILQSGQASGTTDGGIGALATFRIDAAVLRIAAAEGFISLLETSGIQLGDGTAGVTTSVGTITIATTNGAITTAIRLQQPGLRRP